MAGRQRKQAHGLLFGAERLEGRLFLTIKAYGKLDRGDYECLGPMLESAVNAMDHPDGLALIDCREFEGWDSLGAAWQDLKLDMAHGGKFERVAIVGEGRLIDWSTRVGDWFTEAELKVFRSPDEALAWLGVEQPV